jgi:NAD(P)H-quinone oxidoreductase subunit 5
VLTAILKSVQFPFHTWLLGVLESPTPVSALLHAGLLNAGPFLIIRFSNLFADSTVASTTLIIVGAISALFGSIVYITQTSVKTGLVYSSIGHMGFSLLLCGMGMFSAAMLHLVSHSFYKAYSFLNSGNTINEMKAVNKNNYQRTGNPFKIIVAIAISFGVFSAFQYLLVQYFNLESQISFVGFVILIGIMGLYINAMDAKNYFRTILSIIGLSVFLLLSFFLFEELIRKLIQSEIPAETILHPVNQIIAIIILIVFMITVMFQSIITIPGHSNFATALRVHIKNGFYIESFVNRLSRKSNNPAHTGLKTKNLN